MDEPGVPSGPPWVGLPATFDRRMRLGPFPSVRDALKFATYAAVGAVPAALVAPIWWLPFLGGGFLVATYHPEGKPADERAGEFVTYQWRRGSAPRGRAPRRTPWVLGPVVPVGDAALVAVLEVAGTPVAFLPSDESRALFDRFRDLLRAVEGGLYIVMSTEPISGRPFQPSIQPAPPAPEARSGYSEMVRILCERRRRRKVLLTVWVPRGAGGMVRLERTVATVTDHLGQIGARAERLTDQRLADALDHIGWDAGRAP